MTDEIARAVVVFGQFENAADPVNLPAFAHRLMDRNINTILIPHDATARAIDHLRDFRGPKALVGASLGAMSVIVFAKYLMQSVAFGGGFQPSDFDPSGVTVAIEEQDPPDLITRAIYVPKTVKTALCFRNPVLAATGGLGHATWIADDPHATQLTVVKRLDVHPGDFGVAADQMFDTCTKALGI